MVLSWMCLAVCAIELTLIVLVAGLPLKTTLVRTKTGLFRGKSGL